MRSDRPSQYASISSSDRPLVSGTMHEDHHERQQADGAVDPEGERRADAGAVVEDGERLRDDVARHPDGERGHRHGPAADLVGEDLGAQEPADRPQRHRERRR